MISASLAVEGPPRGLGLPGPGHIDHHHHSTHHAAALHAVAGAHHPGVTHPPFVTAYHHHTAPPPPPAVEAWRGGGVTTSKQEFLRPLPKPLTTRYNGIQTSTTPSNNTSNNPLTSIRTNRSPKYSPPATNTNNIGPVNLVQHKEESPPSSTISTISISPPQEDLYSVAGTTYPRLFPNYAYTGLGGPYGVYTSPYTQLLSRQPHLEPSTFLTPPQPSAYSPSSSTTIPSAPSSPLIKPSQTQLKERRVSAPTTSTSISEASLVNFKVPSGKEGSLKHRILTRPNDTKKTFATTSTRTLHTNNNTIPGGFAKGSLIELGNGELRKIEDMRTEDFILSAEHSPELRLTDSTVIRIEENPILGSAIITLSYNQNRTQVEFESSLEHPLFVYGHGWASCAPERTLQCYGLKCHPLQVGDVCVSFTPRETPPAHIQSQKNATITTTATTTAMTPRQIPQRTSSTVSHINYNPNIVPSSVSHTQPPRTHSAEEIAAIEASNARKRRWSAPDQICDDDEVIPMRRIRE